MVGRGGAKGRRSALEESHRGRGAAWLAHWPVKPEAAGSSPVDPAIRRRRRPREIGAFVILGFRVGRRRSGPVRRCLSQGWHKRRGCPGAGARSRSPGALLAAMPGAGLRHTSRSRFGREPPMPSTLGVDLGPPTRAHSAHSSSAPSLPPARSPPGVRVSCSNTGISISFSRSPGTASSQLPITASSSYGTKQVTERTRTGARRSFRMPWSMSSTGCGRRSRWWASNCGSWSPGSRNRSVEAYAAAHNSGLPFG